MIDARVLKRGVAGPKALTEALNELGIDDGEEFAIIRSSSVLVQAILRGSNKHRGERLTEDEFVDLLKTNFDGVEEDDDETA